MSRTPTRDRIVELRRVPASDLRANPRNWRRHPATQAQALRAVLDKVGYAGAVLARDTGDGLELIDGHLRQEIADETPVPVLVVDLDEDEAALMLATLDPLGAMAETDEQALFDLLQDVLIPDAGLAAALEEMTGQAGPPVVLGDPDEVPEPPTDPVTRCGDLWILGDHRLLCGDATSRDDVERVMAGYGANLCLTDPPYGVGIAYNQHDDSRAELERLVAGFMPLALEVAEVALITPGNSNTWVYPEPAWTLAWVEQAGTGMNPWGFTCWQPVLAYGKDPYLAHGMGSRPDLFMGVGEGASSDEHPVAKPVGIWTRILERGSVAAGDVIFDPFGGSGTTMIAAEQTGRIAHLLEIDPVYCDVIVARWEQFTGQSATREEAAA